MADHKAILLFTKRIETIIIINMIWVFFTVYASGGEIVMSMGVFLRPDIIKTSLFINIVRVSCIVFENGNRPRQDINCILFKKSRHVTIYNIRQSKR